MEEVWTVRKALNWTKDYFRKADIAPARFEAEILLAHALEIERLQLYLHPERTLTIEERGRFRQLVESRRAGTPLQYLTGSTEFYNCHLRVDHRVLIPRPETEQLVERVLADHEGRPLGRALDLGTGSGAIAIALALARPDAQIMASDRSAAALQLARENAARSGVVERIDFRCSNWFAELPDIFDLIIANPPYISSAALAQLPAEIRANEPAWALNGGTDGLEAVRQIVQDAPAHLRPGGHLYLEIGAGQAPAIQQLLNEGSDFTALTISEDLAGHPRFVRAQRA